MTRQQVSDEVKLNPHEEKILAELQKRGYPSQSKDLGKVCFGKGRSIAQAHSWARNALRRLVELGKVERIARGVYQSK